MCFSLHYLSPLCSCSYVSLMGFICQFFSVGHLFTFYTYRVKQKSHDTAKMASKERHLVLTEGDWRGSLSKEEGQLSSNGANVLHAVLQFSDDKVSASHLRHGPLLTYKYKYSGLK